MSSERIPRGVILAALLALAVGCGGPEAPSAPPPARTDLYFRDAAADAGLTEPNHSGTAEAKNFIHESMGPGAAWLDYDNDGWIDLYVPDGDVLANYELVPLPARGREEPTFLLQRKSAGTDDHHDHLWRNNGDGTFSDVSRAAGIREARWSYGVTAFDYDADGWTDLFVANLGHDVLWHNNGDGTFTDVAAQVGLLGSAATWSTGASVGDVDGDGRLDLYIGAFADMGREIERVRRKDKLADDTPLQRIDGQFCTWRGVRAYCGPGGLAARHDRLLCQTAQGTFEDRTDAYGLRPRVPCFALTSMMHDFDGDGRLDIYVANDSTENFLWQQVRDADGSVRFQDVAELMGVKVGPTLVAQASMGLSVADVNGDGLFDLTITNFSNDHNNLFVAHRRGGAGGRGYFRDRGLPLMGREVHDDLAWGVGWQDFDNDADLDLFIANGHVYPGTELRHHTGLEYAQHNALFECLDGASLHLRQVGPQAQARLEERSAREALDAGPGLEVKACSRAAAFGDYDNDGRVDVFVGNLNAAPTLLRNESVAGRAAGWIKLRLQQPGSNRDALGAVVVVEAGERRIQAVVTRQMSYLGSDDPRLHVGLGRARTCTVRVRWPGVEGAESVFRDLAAGKLWLLDRARGEALPGVLPALAPDRGGR